MSPPQGLGRGGNSSTNGPEHLQVLKSGEHFFGNKHAEWQRDSRPRDWKSGGEMGLETQTGRVSAAGGVSRLSLGRGEQGRMEETPGESWSGSGELCGWEGQWLSAAEAAEVGLSAEQSVTFQRALGAGRGHPSLCCDPGRAPPLQEAPRVFLTPAPLFSGASPLRELQRRGLELLPK